MVICTKSSDQGVLQRGDQAACKRVKQLTFVRLSAGISRTIFEYNQAIKIKFCQSKFLILVANDSTGGMSVTIYCTAPIFRGLGFYAVLP